MPDFAIDLCSECGLPMPEVRTLSCEQDDFAGRCDACESTTGEHNEGSSCGTCGAWICDGCRDHWTVLSTREASDV